ncbi:MAG: site-specific DNA-methyltransferase [Alistipes sp.]|jgi:site-specific DNA-methyltransferase (adenine-specific)|nr:site-specific DNA-methyltransferase [Alistipes sp.]
MKIAIDENITLYLGDCLDVMPRLAAEGIKVELVLTDPPYGTTHCRWDYVIPFAPMWDCVRSVSHDNTPALLFCQQPFTSTLGHSNLKELRYSWVWEKTQPTGFLNAKRMPMKAHEDILVFYRKLPKYNPVMTGGHTRKVVLAKHRHKCSPGTIYNGHGNYSDYSSTSRYPRSVLKYKTEKQTCCLHPTQKPVALLEYLISTYTDEGDMVLDFAMGGGSTAIACRNTGRKFIGIEIDEHYFDVAESRIRKFLNGNGK